MSKFVAQRYLIEENLVRVFSTFLLRILQDSCLGCIFVDSNVILGRLQSLIQMVFFNSVLEPPAEHLEGQFTSSFMQKRGRKKSQTRNNEVCQDLMQLRNFWD